MNERERLTALIGHFDHTPSSFLISTSANLEKKAEAYRHDRETWNYFTVKAQAYMEAALLNEQEGKP